MSNAKPADEVSTQVNTGTSVPEQTKPADTVADKLNVPAPEPEPPEEP